jgi:hypothetical protein
MDFTTLIWLFIIFAAFTPAMQRRYQEACRRWRPWPLTAKPPDSQTVAERRTIC